MKSLLHKFGFIALFGCSALAGEAADETYEFSSAYKPDLSSNFKKGNAFRSEISLNGVWKISLQDKIGDAAPADQSAYGYVLVPSAWTYPSEFPITGTPDFKLGKWSEDCRWKGKPMKDYPCAWYTRKFNTPQDLDGRKIFLKLDRITMSGSIFLNGQSLGEQNEREDCEYDVSALLRKDGVANELAVRVSAILNEEVKSYLGGDNTVMTKIVASLRGITGDVWLISRPAGPFVSDVFVTSSVRKKEIRFDIELSNDAKSAGKCSLLAEVFEKGGSSPVARFEQKNVKLDGSTLQKVSFGGAWTNPVLWDTDNPHLYEVKVSLLADGKKIDEQLPEPFGFREVWLDGHDIIMNGKPVHLFSFHTAAHDAFVNAARKNVEREIAIMRSVGFNSIQLGSEGTFTKGRSAQYYGDIFDIADTQGLPVIMPVAPVYAYEWQTEAGKKKWQSVNLNLIRKYRNHPSLICYSLNFNYLGYAGDLNPRYWGTNYMPPDNIGDLGRKRKEAGESEQFVRGSDPSRLVYHHASGNFGSFITSNFYTGWPPIQELEDFLSLWNEKGVKPFIPVEIALPVYCLDLNRARLGNYETTRYSEMLEAEYLAPFLGPSAFRMQTDGYLDILSRGATAEKIAGADKYDVNQSYTWGYNLSLHEPVESGIVALRPRFFQSWRTYGMNGFSPNNALDMEITGRTFEPWQGAVATYTYDDYTVQGPKPLCSHVPLEQDKKLTKAGQAFVVGLKPVLAYFGGSSKDGFSSKDHAWFAGDSIEKQIVVVNDLRRDLDLAVKWSMISNADGAALASGEEKMTVAAGRSGFRNIKIVAPELKEKSSFTLKMEIAGLSSKDAVPQNFKLQVFPKAGKPSVASVALFDPAGETAAMLGKMGVKAVSIDAKSDLSNAKLIVIGRDALAKEKLPVNVLKAVCEQGATALFFEQRDLGIFGLRMHQRGVRTVFPLDVKAPVFAGLGQEDLCDWRGDVSLSAPYSTPQSDSPDSYPEEAYKWGNRGVVCSFMIEKPHVGAARPLAECEFDLNFTPLLEVKDGKGRLIFCQMEVTNRYGLDPAATRLANNLMTFAASSVSQPPAKIECGSDMKDYSDFVNAVRGQDGGTKIIVRRGAALKDNEKAELRRIAEDGGTVVLVSQELMKDLSWLPSSVKTKNVNYYRAEPRGASPLMAGVSVSDLFLKDKRKDLLVEEGSGVNLLSDPGIIAEVPAGKGRFILFAIDPLSYKNSKISPERMDRIYSKLTRTLSTIIANLGGSFKPLSERYLSGAEAGNIPLPPEWRFSIDPENTGLKKQWQSTAFDDSSWRMLKLGAWENQGVNDPNPNYSDAKRPYDGFAWYRCMVKIPESYKGKELYLFLGPVDDMDTTYFNGEKIGSIGQENKEYWAAIRDYPIPAKLIKYGAENVIAVRVLDIRGDGGLMGKEQQIRVGNKKTYPYFNEKPPFNPYKLTRW
ncbi:MAG TPA: hypothetical protein DCZ94_18900 [Lentisphaeria bacterium]|nr:MAG: hypothetical protein A2X48_22000 [Lentisphaerae bacterium GWF2_49_21]HBC89013.1 hypothetical protein [Lentisphaeria bacterium]